VQFLGAIGEWIIGNTFSCALFFTYGSFWLVQGTSLIPSFAVGANYSAAGDSYEGMQTQGYNATLGMYYVTLAIITLIYAVCSVRTNLCLLVALSLLFIDFCLFSGAYFQVALGNSAHAVKLQEATGAFLFVVCLVIWYIFLAQILDAVDFPFTVPVGDLSTIIPGKAQKAQTSQAEA